MATTTGTAAADERAVANRERFRRYAWVVLGWNLLVVLWGALVRASGSGAGCGDHWPLCNGDVVPQAPQLTTIIEFTHRVSSGIALALVVVLCVWALRGFPAGHPARRAAGLSVLFILLEALLGAGLVLLRLVAQNESAGRAIYLSAHLVNTQLLLAVLAMCAYFGGPRTPQLTGRVQGALLAVLGAALAVSITGAVAALGDTLYPAPTLAAGMMQDFSARSSVLLRLRAIHPAVAIIGGVWIAVVAFARTRDERTRRAAYAATIAVIAQLCVGAVNVALRAPIWLQIGHLLVADVLWICLILLFLQSREAGPNAGARVSSW